MLAGVAATCPGARGAGSAEAGQGTEPPPPPGHRGGSGPARPARSRLAPPRPARAPDERGAAFPGSRRHTETSPGASGRRRLLPRARPQPLPAPGTRTCPAAAPRPHRGRARAGAEGRAGRSGGRAPLAAAGLRLGWARAAGRRSARSRGERRGCRSGGGREGKARQAEQRRERKAGGRRRRRRARPAALDDGRPVRLRRWRHLLRRLGGRESPRARHLHRAQGAGRVCRLLVPRLRGGGRLHLAQRQHLPGLLGAGQAPRAGRGDEGQVDVPRRVVSRFQGALRGAAKPQHAGPLRGHLEQRAAGRIRRGDLRGRRWAPAGGAPRAAAPGGGREWGWGVRACVGAPRKGPSFQPRALPAALTPGAPLLPLTAAVRLSRLPSLGAPEAPLAAGECHRCLEAAPPHSVRSRLAPTALRAR